jgi:hypothetical protein
MNQIAETYLPAGIDPQIAARHLKLLEPVGTFLFQSFDERKKDKRPELTRVTAAMAELAQMHALGAGAYVTVNKTLYGSRKSEDITAIRAVWSEQDDGVARKFPLDPTFTVETSPGHFHHYWVVADDWPADADGRKGFAAVMERMVADHGCDKAAKDISLVLRLAGSLHRKSLHIEGAARASDPHRGGHRQAVHARAVARGVPADRAATGGGADRAGGRSDVGL